MTLFTPSRAVVTGAGSGLGRAFVLELVRRGVRVVAADVNLAGAETTAAMAGGGESVRAVRCDVSSADEVQSLADEAERSMGGVDLVINNAGVAVSGNVGDVKLEDWRWIVGVNLWGVVHGCHAFVPRFRAKGRGAILNVASAAGLISLPTMAPYNVTKAAVVALSETLRGELDGTGIHVTVLCPTFFRTGILDSARSNDTVHHKMVGQRMDRAKMQADDVARFALDAVNRGHLYAVPHSDGRWAWRAKRFAPERFQSIVPRVMRRMG